MDYLMAFLVGGSICALGQLIFDTTKLTMAHVMVLFVVLGSVLSGLGLYDVLVDVGGAGATVPVSNFGYVLTRGILTHLEQDGWYGILSGAFEMAGAAIAAAVIFGFTAALVFRPKG